jgi:hypothetical protein
MCRTTVCGHWPGSPPSPASTWKDVTECLTTGYGHWLASLPSPGSVCAAVSKCQTTGYGHLPASLPSPASTCPAVPECQTTGCGHWLASLPSPDSVCTAVAKCQTTGCGLWPGSPPSRPCDELVDGIYSGQKSIVANIHYCQIVGKRGTYTLIVVLPSTWLTTNPIVIIMIIKSIIMINYLNCIMFIFHQSTKNSSQNVGWLPFS